MHLTAGCSRLQINAHICSSVISTEIIQYVLDTWIKRGAKLLSDRHLVAGWSRWQRRNLGPIWVCLEWLAEELVRMLLNSQLWQSFERMQATMRSVSGLISHSTVVRNSTSVEHFLFFEILYFTFIVFSFNNTRDPAGFLFHFQ